MSDLSDSALIERWQRDGDSEAREELVDRYRGLVRSLAARYVDRGEPFDDLLQVAWIGLLKAIDRFDPARELRLASYATPTIVGEIRRYYRDHGWAIRVPRPLHELRVRANGEIDRFTAAHGSAPTIRELAALLGHSEDEVLDALQTELARAPAPLQTTGSDGEERMLAIEAEEAGFDEVDTRMLLEHGLAELADRERRIVELRFDKGLTQLEIASQLGISQMHVSRLLRQALEALRHQLDP